MKTPAYVVYSIKQNCRLTLSSFSQCFLSDTHKRNVNRACVRTRTHTNTHTHTLCARLRVRETGRDEERAISTLTYSRRQKQEPYSFWTMSRNLSKFNSHLYNNNACQSVIFYNLNNWNQITNIKNGTSLGCVCAVFV